MAALWTEVCLFHPALDALNEGFEVYPVVDCIGGTSLEAHEAGLQRLVQAGAKPTSWVQLICESQPFAAAAAIVRANERLKRSFSDFATPLLILHGTADKAARPSGSEHFIEQAGSPDRSIKLYEGRFHDPLNDLRKEQVMTDILEWLDSRIVFLS